jgi:hypothetical protein
MPIRPGFALALAVLCAAPARASDTASAPGSLSLPVTTAALASAAGVHRDDPSTLGIDIVRIAFASPKPTDSEVTARGAIARALSTHGPAAGWLPLPLSPDTWRRHVLGDEVQDDRLAAAIFGRRAAALVYHGLMGIDPATIAWIEGNPAVLDAMVKNPGVTAAFARSIRVRDGRIVTPGEEADAVWTAVVGADPRDPVRFARSLVASKAGRTAAFYDAVAHADAAHRRFAIGRPADRDRIARAVRFFEAAVAESPSWRIDDRPFMRADVTAALLIRLVGVDDAGRPIGPAPRRFWARVFGIRDGGDDPVDAAWLAGAILGEGGSTRGRLETFLFAQRALARREEDFDAQLSAIEGFRRFPALMLTLESNGVRAASDYAAAARAAAAVSASDDTLAVFQAGLAIVDLARRAGTIPPEGARALIASLSAAASTRGARAALLEWIPRTLVPALTLERRETPTMDAAVLHAVGGYAPRQPVRIAWEGQAYVVDLGGTERRRIERIRTTQEERSLDEAHAASSSRDLMPLAHSLAAIVYASAMGEPDSQAVNGGPVWRRHRFGPDAPAQGNDAVAWRIATEVFGAGGWHLVGSLLRLDVSLAHLALRRLDATEMPLPSRLSTRDRRTLAISVALIDPLAVSDADLAAVAAALARGRERAAALAAGAAQADLDRMAVDAGLSEWRVNAARWALANEPPRAAALFTTLELYRLGGGKAPASLGAAALPLDGCLCLRMPPAVAWEELAGRASTGQLASELADVMLRSAEALAARRLPALLIRGVAAFAMQDVIDRARPAYFDDWLPIAFAARDLDDERFDDYVAALAAGGPLVPAPRTAVIQ